LSEPVTKTEQNTIKEMKERMKEEARGSYEIVQIMISRKDRRTFVIWT